MLGWKKMTYQSSIGPDGCGQSIPKVRNGESPPVALSGNQDAAQMVVKTLCNQT